MKVLMIKINPKVIHLVDGVKTFRWNFRAVPPPKLTPGTGEETNIR